MTRLALCLLCLTAGACAVPPEMTPAALIPGNGDTKGVAGLERVANSGAYEMGATEHFVVHVDPAIVTSVEWRASGGSLTASGRSAEWKLPNASSATLKLTTVRVDGSRGVLEWQFALTPSLATTSVQSAQAALLAMPMPVLDGGSIEVSGGACEVRYEGTTSNVAIAFTTATHPALMYGRWNGSAWTLEVVDALGFNIGGVVEERHVSFQVEANGTPHLAYVRDGQVFYATKSGGAWVRERVDSASVPFQIYSFAAAAPSVALNGSTPWVLYQNWISGPGYHPVLANRTGPNTWTRTTLSSTYMLGDLAFDGSGRPLFPVLETSSIRLGTVALPATSVTAVTLGTATSTPTNTRVDSALGGSHLVLRYGSLVYDATLNATFSSTTSTTSPIELNGVDVGDIEWNAATGRPVVLHQHGSALELVTPNASGFWTFTQLASSTGASASLAVHPTTGEVSVCYQANSRIMFQ